MNVIDRSNGSEGTISQHGCTHLGTSDKGAAAQPGSTVPDGAIAQAPRVPSYRDFTEIAQIEDGHESEGCSAETADLGGEAGEGKVSQVAKSPVTANLDKMASVRTHPTLMSAHRRKLSRL